MTESEDGMAGPPAPEKRAASGASADPRTLITVVIPVFNEERNLEPAYDAVRKVFDEKLVQYRFEILFTDNHSTDGTFARLRELAGRDPRVRALRFTRNYGFQRSVLTGYQRARGAAAIQLDCDLQDPPGLFPAFLAKWEEGHDVVVGIRGKRPERWLLSAARRRFYALMSAISDENLLHGAGDFRLVDRSILDQLRGTYDAQPYLRGLVSTLARRQVGIPYDRQARLHEQSKYSLRGLYRFALDGIFGHSVLPLRLATYTGIGIAFVTLLLSAFYLVSRLAFGSDWPPGFATTTILILFGISLNGIFVGILGEYVGRIYGQVRRRPLTVIEESLNVDAPTQVGASRQEEA